MVAAGLAVAAYLHWAGRWYYPVARVAGPEGVTFVAFANETEGRAACAEANERFIEPLQRDCASCKVLSATCEERDAALKLVLDATAQSYVVHSPRIRVAVSGPEHHARASCELIAATFVQQGIAQTRCSAPRK